MTQPLGPFGRFVALGDSFTEGMQDELGPDGRHLGWADRVAETLALASGGLAYANLAVRGRLLDEVVDEQLPSAIELGADLVSFHGGGNDVLRPNVDLDELGGRYDAAVARLRASGAQVVLFTVLERTGGTGRLSAHLAERIGRFNGRVVRPTAQRHGALLVDVGAVRALHDRRMWHEDRLHLVAEGHRRVAAAVLERLGIDDERALGGPAGWWRVPLERATPPGVPGAVAAEVRWVRRHLLPWVSRRIRGVSSGDGVTSKRPELTELRPPA